MIFASVNVYCVSWRDAVLYIKKCLWLCKNGRHHKMLFLERIIVSTSMYFMVCIMLQLILQVTIADETGMDDLISFGQCQTVYSSERKM